MDYSKVKDKEARRLLESFFMHREVNRKIYQLIPEGRFDYRMVDRGDRKSDSPRESLAHQINVQRGYIGRVIEGGGKFNKFYDGKLGSKSKEALLEEMKLVDKELVDFMSVPENLSKKVRVTWSDKLIPVMSAFWGMVEHEVFHSGWNVALMDHWGIESFEEMKKLWG